MCMDSFLEHSTQTMLSQSNRNNSPNVLATIQAASMRCIQLIDFGPQSVKVVVFLGGTVLVNLTDH